MLSPRNRVVSKVINLLALLVFFVVTIYLRFGVVQSSNVMAIGWPVALVGGFFAGIFFLLLTLLAVRNISQGFRTDIAEATKDRLRVLLAQHQESDPVLFQSAPIPGRSILHTLLYSILIGVALILGAILVISLISDPAGWGSSMKYIVPFAFISVFGMWFQGAFIQPVAPIKPGAYFQVFRDRVVLFPTEVVVPFTQIAEISISTRNLPARNSIMVFTRWVVNLALNDGSTYSFTWMTPRRGASDAQAEIEFHLKEFFELLGFTAASSKWRTLSLTFNPNVNHVDQTS